MARTRYFKTDLMSASSQVSGSFTLITVLRSDGTRLKIAVDFGIYHNDEGENAEIFCDMSDIDVFVITHAHADHCGRLPLAIKNGYANVIYTSVATAHLLPIAITNTHSIIKLDAKKNKEAPIYDSEDVSAALSLVRGIPYEKRIEVADHVWLTLFSNSHLIGAASVLLEIQNPDYLSEEHNKDEHINLFFTGDLKIKGNPFKEDTFIPEEILKMPIHIITESTYGDTTSEGRDHKQFRRNVLKAVDQNKMVLVPVLALGRCQEVLHILTDMQKKGELPRSVPIFLDGRLAQTYTRVFSKIEEIRLKPEDFMPPNLEFILKEGRCDLLSNKHSCIILTTSGNGCFGPATAYIPRFLESNKSLIQFTSFLPKGSLGRKIMEAEQGSIVEVNGQEKQKCAWVENTEEFSSHARMDELITYFDQFKDLRSILLTHGEEDTKDVFQEELEKIKKYEGRVHILSRRQVFRLDHWGVDKTINSKLP